MAVNLGVLNLLQGLEFIHQLKTVSYLLRSHPLTFDRDLQSLFHLPEVFRPWDGMGLFLKNSGMTEYALDKNISSKRELAGVSVIANVNFSHVHPFAPVPVGVTASVKADRSDVPIKIFSYHYKTHANSINENCMRSYVGLLIEAKATVE
ncbi:hypothetical protein D0469_17645 [Peribacillus saganii]|uniref:Uncharacterized protein n=1 Tax=Peribacillus saganii TaxID=2303992 RepID=A0A372LJ87_9BACI|nr:hypothetical protein [Peribacillus saganii]RFU66452.1 hypothetical protein D0469_17645 [Peribacillus saganii]